MMLIWIGFVILVLLLLALDLGVFHRHAHVVSVTEALIWSFVWIMTALAFNAGVYFLYQHGVLGIGLEIGHSLTGRQAAIQFFTGYLIEKSLSLDNIFVIAMIFAYFRVPAIYQHRVLFWGILGALVMRGVMIGAGTALIHRFDWVVYAFGLLLIVTAVKMLITRHDTIEPNRNPGVRLARRLVPMTSEYYSQRFFLRLDGKLTATPLLVALVVVESSDLLFAVDSIPAIFAVTRDPFLVFTSNVFAILGLRSLYFAMAGIMHRFRYLKMSLVFLLAFVGVKMLLSHHYPLPTPVSLAVIAGILSVGILASVAAGYRDTAPLASPLPEAIDELTVTAWRNVRRSVVLITGWAVVLAGLVMLVLPGPAWLVIPLGLLILSTESQWSRRLLRRFRPARRTLPSRDETGANG